MRQKEILDKIKELEKELVYECDEFKVTFSEETLRIDDGAEKVHIDATEFVKLLDWLGFEPKKGG